MKDLAHSYLVGERLNSYRLSCHQRSKIKYKWAKSPCTPLLGLTPSVVFRLPPATARSVEIGDHRVKSRTRFLRPVDLHVLPTT